MRLRELAGKASSRRDGRQRLNRRARAGLTRLRELALRATRLDTYGHQAASNQRDSRESQGRRKRAGLMRLRELAGKASSRRDGRERLNKRARAGLTRLRELALRATSLDTVQDGVSRLQALRSCEIVGARALVLEPGFGALRNMRELEARGAPAPWQPLGSPGRLLEACAHCCHGAGRRLPCSLCASWERPACAPGVQTCLRSTCWGGPYLCAKGDPYTCASWRLELVHAVLKGRASPNLQIQPD